MSHLPPLPFHICHSSSRAAQFVHERGYCAKWLGTRQDSSSYHSSSLLSPLSSSPSVRIFQAALTLPSVSAPILTYCLRALWGEAMSGRHVPLQCV